MPDIQQIEMVAVLKIKNAVRNARVHSDKQVKQVARSIERWGFTNPILIDEDDQILAGHCRASAARLLGMTEVPCRRVVNLSPAERRAYLLADNKLALVSTWNEEILASELSALVDVDYDLSLTGFDDVEIDTLLTDAAEAEPMAPCPEDRVPKMPRQAVTQPGDLWYLGRHRLLCGDAKDQSAISRLMMAELADMIITDSPYNVPIVGHVTGRGHNKHREFVEASGEMSCEQFTAFLRQAFEAMEAVCRNGAIVFTFIDWRHLREILDAGYAVFSELKNLIVWAKTNSGLGTFYRSQHELILVWKVGDQPHKNMFGLGEGGRHRSNLWTYPGCNSFKKGRLEELSLHPTVKPVALIADAMRDVSSRGDVVLDPFGGSGTTVIAAQKVGRRARVVEIDGGYCDVIIQRWQKMTGECATLDESGETFERVSAARHMPSREMVK